MEFTFPDHNHTPKHKLRQGKAGRISYPAVLEHGTYLSPWHEEDRGHSLALTRLRMPQRELYNPARLASPSASRNPRYRHPRLRNVEPSLASQPTGHRMSTLSSRVSSASSPTSSCPAATPNRLGKARPKSSNPAWRAGSKRMHEHTAATLPLRAASRMPPFQ
jgi:hypothetical protein